MLNYIWVGLMLSATVLGVIHHKLPEVVGSITTSATTAVTIALGLVGVMALWLGLMKIAEASGLLTSLTRLLQPVLRLLFPGIPKQHPAMDAISLNIGANMLGLSNAAVPFGLKAMEQLESLNPHPGIATDSMCMLIAINTSSVQLIPLTAIALLSINGDLNASSIIFPTLVATTASTIAAIIAAKWLSKRRFYRIKKHEQDMTHELDHC